MGSTFTAMMMKRIIRASNKNALTTSHGTKKAFFKAKTPKTESTDPSYFINALILVIFCGIWYLLTKVQAIFKQKRLNKDKGYFIKYQTNVKCVSGLKDRIEYANSFLRTL